MSVLEAAYDLNSDDVAWLTSVARAMHPFLDRGFGTHAFLYTLSPSASSLEVHTAVVEGQSNKEIAAKRSTSPTPWPTSSVRSTQS